MSSDILNKTPKKRIVVTGASGLVGRSVIRELTHDGYFEVVAAVEKGAHFDRQEFSGRSLEVREVDYADTALLSELCKGAYGLWGCESLEDIKRQCELERCRNVVTACKEAQIKHLVWGVLQHSFQSSPPHAQETVDFLNHCGVPCTIARTGLFFESVAALMSEPRGEHIDFFLPGEANSEIFVVSATDVGCFVRTLFSREQFIGQEVWVVSELLLARELPMIFSAVTGIPSSLVKRAPHVSAGHVDDEVFRQFRELSTAELSRARDVVDQARSVWPGALRFETWLSRTGWRGGPAFASSAKPKPKPHTESSLTVRPGAEEQAAARLLQGR